MTMRMGNINHIQPIDLLEKMKTEKLLIIDVRESYELEELPFEQGINIPMYTFINNFRDLLKKEDTYYILCHHGQRSLYVTKILVENGYDAINIFGGVDLVNRFR